jgi:hypothetical protein
MQAYSFDGNGLNDANDPYYGRVATFTNKTLAMEHGCLLAAAPSLFDALDRVLKTIPADRMPHDVYVSARLAILAARGTL